MKKKWTVEELLGDPDARREIAKEMKAAARGVLDGLVDDGGNPYGFMVLELDLLGGVLEVQHRVCWMLMHATENDAGKTALYKFVEQLSSNLEEGCRESAAEAAELPGKGGLDYLEAALELKKEKMGIGPAWKCDMIGEEDE